MRCNRFILSIENSTADAKPIVTVAPKDNTSRNIKYVRVKIDLFDTKLLLIGHMVLLSSN